MLSTSFAERLDLPLPLRFPDDGLSIGPSGDPLTYLLVEDSSVDVMLVAEAMNELPAGGRLHTVRDGEDAVRFLRRRGRHCGAPRPDIIILDLNLPVMGGREVLVEIREDEETKRIPVIVFTTSSAEHDVREAYALGANCFITKPTDLDDFIGVLQAVDHFWRNFVRLPGG